MFEKYINQAVVFIAFVNDVNNKNKIISIVELTLTKSKKSNSHILRYKTLTEI